LDPSDRKDLLFYGLDRADRSNSNLHHSNHNPSLTQPSPIEQNIHGSSEIFFYSLNCRFSIKYPYSFSFNRTAFHYQSMLNNTETIIETMAVGENVPEEK